MDQEKSIALIVCYYGQFPWYFDFFLHSCQFNPTIDIFIITDITSYNKPVPKNVKIVYRTIDEIITTTTEKLGFDVQIGKPYKLCDFKPAYGLIFSDLIKGYDYWGHSDIDIIYGDLRSFLTVEMLVKHDYISIRHDYTTGCFSIYKNSDLMNNFFKKSKDYIKVFSSYEHFCFDECNFKHDFLTEGGSIFEIDTAIESFTHIVKAGHNQGIINAHFDFLLLEGLPGKIKFDNGKIIYRNRIEGILYHLFWLKRVYHPLGPPRKIPDRYFISGKKIYFKN